jgi:L-histidine Nalpha-methyltransferase / hercynylcysteine S-oxide synthase
MAAAKMGSGPETSPNAASSIIDIRADAADVELKQEIINGLNGKDEKTLPTLLLYDVQGLKLFERITYLDEYYLTGEEIKVLETHAKHIAADIDDQSIIVELGSGYAAACSLL